MAQTVFYNGVILTMEPDRYAQAVLVENGRIVAAGAKELVFARMSGDVVHVDLKGKTLMPAFMDGHSHITALASTMGLVPLAGAADGDEICERLIQRIRQRRLQPGSFVIGFGYDHNFLKEKQHPDKTVLDGIGKRLAEEGLSSDYKIVIGHVSGHMGVANSAALEYFEIDGHTADPEGGMIGRMDDGRTPNGYLEENAFTGISARMPEPGVEEQMANVTAAEDVYLSNGITTIQDGLTKAPQWALLKRMAEKQCFRADIVAYADIKDNGAIVDENPEYDRKYKNHLKLGGYKLFLDGSPQGRTAWMTQPYRDAHDPTRCDPEGYCGYPIYKDSQVSAYVKKAADEHRQILVHCNGDAACRQLIHACEANHCSHVRPVMIHAQLVTRAQLEQMAALGMLVSFFVAHTYYWGDIHLKNFGEERAMAISPVKTARTLGVPATFHQDTPVIGPDMIETLWCAMNRETKAGQVLGEEERVDVLEALSAVTSNCAWQYFEENEKGSIRDGKLADFVILSENPLKTPPHAFKRIKVLETIKEGKTVWKQE